MNTILIVFGVIELLVLLVGGLLTWKLEEVAQLVGCAVLVYGTVATVLAFGATVLIHDHVSVSIR